MMNLSFKRSERLTKVKDFQRLYRTCRRITGNFVVIQFAGATEKKAGFIVSKKISKNAVIRNKFKRRLREIYRNSKWSISTNCHMVIIAKESIINADFHELGNEVRALLQKINDISNQDL